MQDVLERARTSTDRSERIELYQQAQAIFHRDAPWVPLAHAQRLLVVRQKGEESQACTNRLEIHPQRIVSTRVNIGILYSTYSEGG